MVAKKDGYRRKSGKAARGTSAGRPHSKVDRGMNSVKKKGGRRK